MDARVTDQLRAVMGVPSLDEGMTDKVREHLAAARAAREAGETAEARRRLEDALELCRARQEDQGDVLVSVLKALGQIERDEDAPGAALQRYREAVLACRQRASTDTLAHTIRHLADVYQDLDQLREAEPLYVEALGLYRSAPGTRTLDLANAVRPLALLRQRQGQNGEARSLWLEAKSLYEQVGVAAGVDECEGRLRQLERQE
jgi:tetratricopeptide (TPR) repeat protein